MPSGWERDPEYGSPLTARQAVVSIVIFVAVIVGMAFLLVRTARGEPIEPARIYVIDGDTIRVDGREPNWRLVGYNAADYLPHAQCEAEHEAAREAEDLLLDIVAAGHLDLTEVKCSCRPGTEGTPACNSGRRCGVLSANGVNVAEEMIAAGVAAPFTCGATSCPRLPHPWCE
jgi:endonuclease YncB( thermonuclease family)